MNGKKREVLNSSKSFDEEDVIKEIKKIEKLKKFFTGTEMYHKALKDKFPKTSNLHL